MNKYFKNILSEVDKLQIKDLLSFQESEKDSKVLMIN